MAVILVTGANGQLGRELQGLATSFPQHQFYFFTKEELNIADDSAIAERFSSIQPQYCINCAAYTAVDRAETEKALAYLINAKAVENLAIACRKNRTHFLHISTDYVFNGEGKEPYKEDDANDPVNYYGYSKWEGEQLALKANPESIIIRTSWVYSSYGNNFVKTMLRLMKDRSEINVVADQIGSPTYAADLANAILQIIDSGVWHRGIYHYSNEGEISWCDFAFEIKKQTNSNCTVNPITTEQYPTPAKRPAYSVMDKHKFEQTFKLPLKNWKDSLHNCLQKIPSSNT